MTVVLALFVYPEVANGPEAPPAKYDSIDNKQRKRPQEGGSCLAVSY